MPVVAVAVRILVLGVLQLVEGEQGMVLGRVMEIPQLPILVAVAVPVMAMVVHLLVAMEVPV
jgi:hypothetical protein